MKSLMLLIFMAPSALALLFGLATSMTDSQRKANTALYTQASINATRLDVESARNSAEAKLAEYRYSQRCLPAPGQLIEGYVYTASDGTPLPDGTYLCSQDGSTVELKGGVAGQIAVTGNTQVIQEWLNRVQ